MNLYLSRICLNPFFAPALKLAADPYALHCKLVSIIPKTQRTKPDDQPSVRDLLFRIETSDEGPNILVQTRNEPDWESLELAPRALRCPSQTKQLTFDLDEGRHLAFRLLCQPSIRKSGHFGEKQSGKRRPGPRITCRDDEQRLEWLRRKSHECGFVIETVGLSIIEWGNSKPLQNQGGAPIETNEEARKRAFGPGGRQRLGGVRFDGELIITDPARIQWAIGNGIGPQKAFGFGMLSVGPV